MYTWTFLFVHLYDTDDCVTIDYEQSLFFLGPSSKTPETRNDHARDRRRETGEAQRSRASTPLNKSEEKERQLAVCVIRTSLY